MGLSSKQVSSDRNGWNQDLLQVPKPPTMKRQSSSIQQQQPEQLKCPRCDSSNTKFCYYNNYNKSQPRHFCKACKRHWTKGGTLRNVPVGGGRKNKRLKTAAAAKTNSTTTTTTTTKHAAATFNGGGVQTQPPRVGFSQDFFQNLVRQTPEEPINFCTKKFEDQNNNNNGFDLLGSSTLSLLCQNDDQEQEFVPYSNLGSFESNPCSISSTITSIHHQPSNLYDYTSMSSSSMSDHHHQHHHDHHQHQHGHHDQHHHQPWTTTTSSSVMDMTSNWGWDDFDKFVSVEADLTVPWDDADIKP